MSRALTNIANRWISCLALALVASCSTDPVSDLERAPLPELAKARPVSSGSEAGGLRLSAMETFRVQIEGCQSGYWGEYTEASPPPSLYRGDYGCRGRLVEFTAGGLQYTPDPDQDFTTLAVGDYAVFASSDLSATRTVVVARQLSSPLAPGDGIDFRFNEMSQAETKGLLDVTSPSNGTARPDKKGNYPRFQFAKGGIINVLPSNGAAELAFSLECQNGLKNPRDPSKVECASVRLSDIDYVLVEDTFSGAPCTDKSSSGCDRLFKGGNARLIDPYVETLVPTPDMRGGGFRTKIEPGQALATPADMATHPDMMLVLRSGQNYQYFRIKIKVDLDLYLTEIAAAGLSGEE